MDYATYKKIRAYCWQDLSPYIDTKFNNDTLDFQRDFDGRLADINHEYSAAMGLFQTEDLTAREQSAAQLLAAVSNHRRYSWWREPVTPNGTAPAEPLEPWQAAEVWTQTRTAVAEYAFFIPEREAVGLLALVAEERHAATPAPLVTGGEIATPKTNQIMKVSALINECEFEWSTIREDIREASRNGLKTDAHTGKHGMYDIVKARAWAVSMGKIKQDKHIHSLTGAWAGVVTRNKIADE